MFATGFTIFILFLFTGDKGSTSSFTSMVFPSVQIPLLKSVPILGPILSGHNVLTYCSLLAVLLFWVITFKTPLGLRIRAVGQNPDAAQSVGINVNRTRMYALLLSGFFGALGGLYLCMGYLSWFARDITAGRGWIAVAAASLGGNLPLGTFLSSLLFGVVNALANYLASMKVPSEFIQMIPYLATAIALAVYAAQAMRKGRRRVSEPRAGGQKWKKTKILIDCDPGHDDMVAIMLACASPGLELLGVTTVAETRPVRRPSATRCARSPSSAARTSRSPVAPTSPCCGR